MTEHVPHRKPRRRTITNLAYDPADPHRLVFTDSDTGQMLEARVPERGHVLTSHR